MAALAGPWRPSRPPAQRSPCPAQWHQRAAPWSSAAGDPPVSFVHWGRVGGRPPERPAPGHFRSLLVFPKSEMPPAPSARLLLRLGGSRPASPAGEAQGPAGQPPAGRTSRTPTPGSLQSLSRLTTTLLLRFSACSEGTGSRSLTRGLRHQPGQGGCTCHHPPHTQPRPHKQPVCTPTPGCDSQGHLAFLSSRCWDTREAALLGREAMASAEPMAGAQGPAGRLWGWSRRPRARAPPTPPSFSQGLPVPLQASPGWGWGAGLRRARTVVWGSCPGGDPDPRPLGRASQQALTV